MGKYNISQQKIISDYRTLHKVPVMINDEAVVEMIKEEMIKTGKLYPEFASLLDKNPNKTKGNNSLFELSNNNQDFVSYRLEKISEQPKTEIKTKKTYLPQERAVARKYIAAMLKNQIIEAIYGNQGFNVISNPNKISGAEAWQELESAGAYLVHNLHLGQLGIKEPLNRDGLAKDLNTALRQIEELEALVDYPKAFDKKYKEITHGKTLDYSAVIDYLQAVNKHQSAYMKDKLSTLEQLKEPAQRFEKTLNIPAVKDFNKWAGRQETGGSLTGLAIDMALAYMSGGMGAASRAAMKTGQGVTKVVTEQAVKTGMKRETAEIAGQFTGITTSQVTGAGLNSAMFQATKVAGALEDGNFTMQEFEEIGSSHFGLFKFGYVGSAISGPMGAKFGEWVGRLINNDKTIAIILNSSLKQPTTLGKVLTNLSEHTGFIKKSVELGVSGVINTEYMAQDEGISFEEALKNLAQMEGVSKIVMAFLGGKTTKFLTPEKVQKITTELNNCKVETVVYKGQKAIKVITTDGKENFFSSYEELIAFVADKIYTEAAVGNKGVNEGVNQGVTLRQESLDNNANKRILLNNSLKITPEGSVTVEEVLEFAKNSKYPGGEKIFSEFDLMRVEDLANVDPAFAHTLLSAKDSQGLPIIQPQDYYEIYFAYKKNPAETKELLYGERQVQNYCIRDIVYAMGENPTLIKNLLYAKNSNGNYKYPVEMLKFLAQNGISSPDISKANLDIVMSGMDKICEFLEKNNIDTNDIFYFRLSNDNKIAFDIKNHEFKYVFKLNGELDQKIRKEKDVQNVDEISDSGLVRYKGVYEGGFGISHDLLNAEREVKDSNGNVLYKEVYRRSSVYNKYDVVRVEPNGKEYKIGFAEISESGVQVEERNFSIDNDTGLNYVYCSDKAGNRYTVTRVIDARTKKVLSESSHKFKVIDENHFESTENGVKYDIQYSKDKVAVKNENGETFELSIGENGVLDENMLPLLKQLPGSMYVAISKFGLKRLNISYKLDVNGEYKPEKNTMSIKADVVEKGDINTLLHELGHYIDFRKNIHDDAELYNTFKEERAEFEKNASFREKQIMSNFIADTYMDDSALFETIAEINAMKLGNRTSNGYELLEIYLHKYFPKTYAKVSVKLELSNAAAQETNVFSGSKVSLPQKNIDVRQGKEQQTVASKGVNQGVKPEVKPEPAKQTEKTAAKLENIKTDAKQKFMTPEERKVRISKLDSAKISSEPAKEIDALIFELGNVKKSNPQEHLKKAQNIQSKINTLRITNPEEAKKLQQLFNAKVKNPKASEVSDDMVALAVEHLVRQYNVEKVNITQFIESMGFNKFGHYECRVKSDTSLFDKISNYLKDHPDETFADAINDVRDCYGGRFVLDFSKMMNDPEVVKLVNQGKIGEAKQFAAEKTKDELVKLFRTQAEKNPDMFYRVSNYVTKEGNGLFDESHLFEMRRKDIGSTQKGLDCVVLSTDEEVISQGKKKSTKSQRSGYCAFQVNLTINGRSVELQFKTDEVHKVSNAEHWIYDMVTGKDIVGRTEKLEEFVSPLRTLVLDTMPKEVYDNYYTKYTSAWYNWAELKAEGKETPPEPKLQDYAPEGTTFDRRLSMKNLILFDEIAGRIKKGLPVEDGIKEYNERLSDYDTIN